MHLHDEDIKAIHAASSVNKNIAVVLVGGSAIMVEEWNTEVQAILQSFYNGMEGGNALARILFGDVNPSGKLPFSVPKNENALPPFNSFNTEVEYGYYHGYMLMDKNNIEPRYPFGYGLSYTNFQIYDLKSESEDERESAEQQLIKVSVKIKNTGPVAGAEVVQLYIGFSNSSIDRSLKLLKGFQKVYLKPGEIQTLQFNVSSEELKYYNPSSSLWKLEKMKYEVMVGNSSSDDKMLSDKFLIE
jgi:beta-glucosidase